MGTVVTAEVGEVAVVVPFTGGDAVQPARSIATIHMTRKTIAVLSI